MKKILAVLILIICAKNVVFAEQIPIKLIPNQLISTCHDEIQVGDSIKFKIASDVYLKEKIYIKKDTPVIGIVDYANDNGWIGDNAQIDFKTFNTRDVNNNIVIIKSPLYINGFEILKYKGNRKAQFFNYISTFVRGKEVEILPEVDDVRYTIWLEK